MQNQAYINNLRMISSNMTEYEIFTCFLFMSYVMKDNLTIKEISYVRSIQDLLEVNDDEIKEFMENIYMVYKEELLFRRRN